MPTQSLLLNTTTTLFFFLALWCPVRAQEVLSQDQPEALHRGIYELTLNTTGEAGNPYYKITFAVTFTRPDGSAVVAEGFFDGGNAFKVRAYCDTPGTWKWASSSNNVGLDGKSGTFEVVPSDLKGKLRQHPDDPYQFAYDNGDWFLHIGDTGYRFVVASEPYWKEYIDQAVEMGATKIRTWFAMDRGKVDALFTANGRDLSLFYWKEIERRILYTLRKHPDIVLQLIPYAEDTDRIRAYRAGDEAAQLIARYSQARWSSFPNVQWTITNDRKVLQQDTLSGREVHYDDINVMGEDMAKREPWGTLITNHQSRFNGYDHVDEAWSNLISLEDLDQVGGELILEYREKRKQPIVLDEDRYELYRYPMHARYYFRRFMWASLLSGGHATYGGLKTYLPYGGQNYSGPESSVAVGPEPYQGLDQGVSGYFDANRKGMLHQGGHDFRHIHAFFEHTGLTLVNMEPDDAFVGDDPYRWKCAHNDSTYIIYLANPSGTEPGTDYPKTEAPDVTLTLPRGSFSVTWFDPDSGAWYRDNNVEGSGQLTLKAPGSEDWIVLLQKL
uniref:DUF5060 domain-containing protein n=1 Tax=Roseihalotalea indica TaxID=2867963 RepID=A0AA49GR48_9BACT|nr:DUF5060 domain-containing protein [Tunicatimonas sp. TK19036]